MKRSKLSPRTLY